MSSHDTTADLPSSRFLLLPREVRDLIYGFLLVHEIIPIECAVTRIRWEDASATPELLNNRAYPDRYPSRSSWVRRKTWAVPAFDIVTTPSSRKLMSAIRAIHMSYQLSASDIPRRTVEVQVFQVCKQMYEEAKKVFYEKNTFSFTDDFAIATAFSFLCDRPAASLSMISSLELELREDNNLRGTDRAHYPDVRRSSDTQVLQFAYNHFTDLCTLISTNRMRLRHLLLIIQSSEYNVNSTRLTLQESLIWESSKFTNASHPPAWIHPLLKIHDLETLDLHWIRGMPRVLQTVCAVLSMGKNMLANSPRDSVTGNAMHGIHDEKYDQLTFQVLQDINNMGSICIPPEPATRSRRKWSTYVLENRTVHDTQKLAHFNSTTTTFSQRAAIRELLENFYKPFVFHSRLTSKTRNHLSNVENDRLLFLLPE